MLLKLNLAEKPIVENPYGGRGSLVLGITWTEAWVAIILIVLRTYTNAFVIKQWNWDYAWALFTLLTGLVAQAMITVSVLSGLGNHMYLLDGPQLIKASLWSWIGQIVAIHAIGFGKIAVIAFLIRLQDRAHDNRNRALVGILYFIGVSNVIININQMILILLQCDPTPKLWNPSLPGTCDHIHRTNQVAYFQGSWAAMSDVLLAVYPVLVFWNLKISARIKVGLCLLMAGGLVAAAAGIAKTINLKLISVQQDILYYISTLVIWAMTECWLVLILGSLPPLRPLFVSVFRQISSAYAPRSKPTGYSAHASACKGSQGYRPGKRISIHVRPLCVGTTEDTESERHMLSPINVPPLFDGMERGILRTTHVQVSSKG